MPDIDPVPVAVILASLKIGKEYADIIVKPSFEQLGGILSDKVVAWRQKNRINTLLKMKDYIEKRGSIAGEVKSAITGRIFAVA